MTECYVGLMSGTSMDGIDAVVASFSASGVCIHATHTERYPAALKNALLDAIRLPLDIPLDQSGELDQQVGMCFRDAANAVIKKADSINIRAIGSHGQTLRHQPNATPPFTLQIGNADLIAAGTGLTTVANFRSADICAGGQGAPLVPPFHEWLFRSDDIERVVVNIGGIANITILPRGGDDVTGFDTGPGNGLMDTWIRTHRDRPFDEDGSWAASGTVQHDLLRSMLADPYFEELPPKSTGFEYFNPSWLQQFGIDSFAAADVQATLCELSARTIADAIMQHAPECSEVYVCGGGMRNKELIRRLGQHTRGSVVASTATLGLDPDCVEAVAFAWLAMRRLNGETGNLPSVTGASHKVHLGDIHFPRP